MSGLKEMEMADRISDLPRPILHHILAHLSQNDAVKTCVLSKSWRYLWYGRPNLEFCQDDFKGTLQDFVSVLDQTLIRYENQNLSIHEFILKMPETNNSFVWKWFEDKCNNLFTRLKSLRLSSVYLNTKSIDYFSRNYPCLEDLELSNCSADFENFQLSSPSIKRLSIDVYGLVKVSIDAPNMLEFEYKGKNDFFPKHISFTTTSNKWKSKIVWTIKFDRLFHINTSQWLPKLDELLKVLSSRSETSLHILVNRNMNDDYVQQVVKHLELCLGSHLCSDFSLRLDEPGKPTWNWYSKSH